MAAAATAMTDLTKRSPCDACAVAVLAVAFPALGIGFASVSLASDLTVLTMAYAVGHVSGAHFNLAMLDGLWAGGRFPAKDLLPYIVAQVAGGLAGARLLYIIDSIAGFDLAGGFASNGYGEHSPGGDTLAACAVAEVAMTFGFLQWPKSFAPTAVGRCLTLIHLISTPVTTPASIRRAAFGPAIFVGGWHSARSDCSGSPRWRVRSLAGTVSKFIGGEANSTPVDIVEGS